LSPSHDELNARLVLERAQLVVERRALGGRNDVGLVDHAAGQRGKVRRLGEGRAAGEREGRRDQRRDEAPGPRGRERFARTRDQNFTFGAVWASSVAVNSAIGLAPLKKVEAQITVGNVRSATLYARTASI